MTDDSAVNDATSDPNGVKSRDTRPEGFGRQFILAARAVQVRLRFVVVLVVAFLVIGLWGNLRNYWDTLTHRFSGSHVGEQSVSGDTEYFCPMDPGVISDWPAICPVCNMDLVRRKKGEAALLPEGVVARMQFSPYRIQLAGIQTSVIDQRPLAREVLLAGRILEAGAVGDPSPPASADLAQPDRRCMLVCEASAGEQVFLKTGRQAEVSVEALPRVKPFVGTIVAIEDVSPNGTGRHRLTVQIALEGHDPALIAGMFGTARIAVPLAELEPFSHTGTPSGKGFVEGTVAVPETAVVDTGSRRMVFVESMPGMFDGVEVTLGPRCGDYFPVLAGLEPGQKVARAGAFLIDAEARLSPNLAAGYFGAARTVETGTSLPAPAVVETAKSPTRKKTAVKLSAADQQLADRQKICPVTDLPLDSMGGAVAVDIQGQKVFICCKGCESKLKNDPQKYLAKLKK